MIKWGFLKGWRISGQFLSLSDSQASATSGLFWPAATYYLCIDYFKKQSCIPPCDIHSSLGNAAPSPVPISSPKTLLLFYFSLSRNWHLSASYPSWFKQMFWLHPSASPTKAVGTELTHFPISFRQFVLILLGIVRLYTHTDLITLLVSLIFICLIICLICLIVGLSGKLTWRCFTLAHPGILTWSPAFLFDYLSRSFIGLHEPLESL